MSMDATPPSAKVHVLVVDDDRALRRLVTMVLEDEDWEVLEAKDGLEALAILRSDPSPFVVLLDWRMPNMSGEEVLDIVKTDPDLAKRHGYVLFTANGITPSSHITDLLRELAVSILAKPFKIDELLKVVESQAREISLRKVAS